MVPFSITNCLNYDVALMHLVSEGMSKCQVPIAQSANLDLRRGHTATRILLAPGLFVFPTVGRIYLVTALFVHLFVLLLIHIWHYMIRHHTVVTRRPTEVICYRYSFYRCVCGGESD